MQLPQKKKKNIITKKKLDQKENSPFLFRRKKTQKNCSLPKSKEQS